MNTRFALIAGVALAALTGCASDGGEPVNARAAEKLASFDRTGEVDSCLNSRSISSMTPVDERTLLIKVGVNDYYVNDVSGTCGGSVRFGRLEHRSSAGQVCRGDIIRVVDNGSGFQSGACSFGSFEKLAEKPAAP